MASNCASQEKYLKSLLWNLGQYIIRVPSYPRVASLICVMLDTSIDSLATFLGSLNFQMYAFENSRESKLPKITEDFPSSFSLFVFTANTFYQIYFLDIYSKFCDPDTFMPKYKLVIVSSECETVSEKLKGKVLLHPCFSLAFIAQSGKRQKLWTNSHLISGNKSSICLTEEGLLQHSFVLMPLLRPGGYENCHA